jgi:flagellar biosynthetic protein FliR
MGAATAMLAMSFVLALKVAAPVLAAILIATAAAGLIQKTMPQLNILTVGLPVRAMLGLAVLAASLAMLAPLLESALGILTRQWTAAFQIAR